VRKKLVAAAAVGALGLSGAAITGTALAATRGPANGTAVSPLDRIEQALSGLVSDKTLTQAQADKVASTLSAAGVGPGGAGMPGGHGMHHGPGMRGGAELAAAAKALGMSEADLRTALMSGKSLAAVAKEKNVSVDTLVAALVTAAKADLAQAVKDGRLTQAEADARAKDLQARITDRVNATPPPRGESGFGRRPGGGPGWGDQGRGGQGQGGPEGGPTPAPSPSASPSASASGSASA
jgi:hypothetical protein